MCSNKQRGTSSHLVERAPLTLASPHSSERRRRLHNVMNCALVRRAKGAFRPPSSRTDMTTNPPLAPHARHPFDQVLPEHIEPAISAHIAAGNAALNAIA